MKDIGILLAAGSSKRFEADKLFIEYEDRELIRFPIETFLKNKNISLLVIVCNNENIKRKEFTVLDARSKKRFLGLESEPRPGIKSGSIKVNGKIETIQPTGADWIVGLNISGKSIFAISSDQPPGNENDTIGLSFKLDGLHAFDRNDLKLEQD